MTLALPCLMAYELIGQETHEILGLCTVGLFLLHHGMNWQWHRNLFKGKYTAYRTVLTVLDILMIIVFIDQAVTGIMMAKHVFPDLPHVGRRSFARVLHLLGAYWGFTVCCLHAGMHMTGMIRKWISKTGMARVLPAALDQMNKYFLHGQLPVISSRYWNMVHGNTPQEVAQDEEGLQIMRQLGRNMAWFLKLKEAGQAAGVPLPEQEEKRIATNFIR